MLISMNRFKVNPGREADFERMWRERESTMQDVPGFIQFALLKGDTPGDYISHTVWTSREAVTTWFTSGGFQKAHSRQMPEGILQGKPEASAYEAVVLENAASIASA